MGYPYEELCHILKTALAEEIEEKYPQAFYSEEQDHIFNNAKPGDVIFCHMPLSSDELADIPEGHRRRPYLIVDKTEDELIGYFCSHKVADSVWKCQALKLHAHYEFETYVIIKEVSHIKRRHIIAKRFSIDEQTIAEVNRLIHINLNISPEYNKDRLVLFKDVKNSVLLGSIVKKNDKYYCVHRVANNKARVYRMYPDNPDNDENLWYLKNDTPMKYVKLKRDTVYTIGEDIDESNLVGVLDLNELSQLIRIYYLATKNKTKRKKNYSDFRLLYKPGGIYEFRYNDLDDYFVYLFSRRGNDYVTSLNDCEEGRFKIQTVKLYNFKKVDRLKKEALLDLLNEFMISAPSYRSIFANIIKDIF